MSSYLNIYLNPKAKYKTEDPLLLASYSRNTDVYQAFYENISPIHSHSDEEYTPLFKHHFEAILDDLEKDITSTNRRLELYKQYAKDNPDYIQEIINLEEILADYKSAYDTISFYKEMQEDIQNDNTDFECMCCDID